MSAENGALAAQDNRVAKRVTVQQDTELITLYGDLAVGLADLFGQHCAVVLYSLATPLGVILKTVNDVYGTYPLGAHLSQELQMRVGALIQQKESSATYFTQSSFGGPTKSSLQILRNAQGDAMGLLAIHLHLGGPFHELVATFMPQAQATAEVSPENFNNNVEKLVTLTVERTIEGINANGEVANNVKNKQIVTTLYEKGIFDIKDAIAMVSNKLNISKHTVYLYIRQKKRDDEASSPNNPETL